MVVDSDICLLDSSAYEWYTISLVCFLLLIQLWTVGTSEGFSDQGKSGG